MRLPLPFPVSMAGRLSHCALISLRVPASEVEGLVPGPLVLDTVEARGDRWAFWNVVLCRVESMRPRGAPRWLGMTYHHVAYRLRVRTRDDAAGGLFFVRSDADSGLIGSTGNLVSDFRFNRSRITLEEQDRGGGRGLIGDVSSGSGAGDVRVELALDRSPGLASESVFSSVDEAAKRLKYEPMSLAPTKGGDGVRLAEVFRDEALWVERAVSVDRFESAFFTSGPGARGTAPELELATYVDPIDYRWRLGRTMRVSSARRRVDPLP